MTPEERKIAQEAFLVHFRVEANVTVACEAVGIDRNTVYDWRKRYKDFAEQFDEAEQYANDGIDHEIYRRAVRGWQEPMVSAGKYVCDVTKYSDSLLTLLAKSRMQKYREKQQVDLNTNISGSLQTVDMSSELRLLSNEQLAQFKSWLAEAKAKEQE
jgi:transposase-like protein